MAFAAWKTRIRILAASCLCATMLTPAFADTGIRALDEASIVVKAPDKVVLIAITRVGNRLVAVGEHGVITYSDDNGVSWKQASVPVTVTLTAIAFANATEGWAVGHYGVILHTDDAGATWQLQLDGIEANKLTMAAAKAAVAQSDQSPPAQHALMRANIFMQAGPDKPFLSIWAPDPKEAIICGAYRMTMKTTDGGKTWADWSLHVDDPFSHNLYDITPVGQNLYIVGEGGLVFRSSDAGDDFATATKPNAATLLGAVATGDGGVFAFGVAGQAYRSDDGGSTWQPVALGASGNLTAATILASGAILVTGEDGGLFLSTDHAHSFKRLSLALPMELFGAAQAADGDVIVVGNRGVIRVPAATFSQN